MHKDVALVGDDAYLSIFVQSTNCRTDPSLTENIDTTTAGGRLTFHILGALAQFERDITRERTVAGLEAAAARGRKGGRPKAMGAAKIEAARQLLAGGMPIKDVAVMLEVGISTLYRYGLAGSGIWCC